MVFDTLIYNGTLVTVNRQFDIIEDAVVGVKGGEIAFVGTVDKAAETTAETRIDAEGGIIMPGLVNAHTHLPMSLFRGLADDLPLADWLNHHIFPAEQQHVRPETVVTGALLSCAEMLLSGTTCCCDGYFYEDAVAEAVDAAGLRAVLGQGVIDFPAPGVPDPTKNVEAARAFVDRWQGRSSLISPSIFCHSPYTCSAETLTLAKAAARDAGALFQVHVAETRNEAEMAGISGNDTPVAYLDRLGVLDPDTLAAHAVWVDTDDLALLADRGTGVSHNPESNMKLASGIAPVPDQIEAGIAVGLGTDGCASNNNLDMFAEMDSAAKLHKACRQEPTTMPAKTVIRMATIEGARALGLADRVGSIEVGKAADMIVIDTKKPHLTPLYHPDSHLVYSVRGADVAHVMVAGRLLVRNRRLLSLDLDTILSDAAAVAEQIRQTDTGNIK